jgi:chloramphenicol O-acetyltransferase type B
MELSLLWLAIKVIGMIGLAPTPSFTKVLKMPRMHLELKWWDWDLDKIKSNMDLICSKNISELYNKNIEY